MIGQSGNVSHNRAALEQEICPNCGKLAERDPFTGWCADCSPINYDRRFYERHEIEILDYREFGCTLQEAIRRVRADIRPRCIHCGDVMRRARAEARYCGKPECRMAYRRARKERNGENGSGP